MQVVKYVVFININVGLIKLLIMNKLLRIIGLSFILLVIQVRMFAQETQVNNIGHSIEFDITDISIFDERVFFMYNLVNDNRFDIEVSDRDGIFVVKNKETNTFYNLKESFESFRKQNAIQFSEMSKEEASELSYRYKSLIPNKIYASLMMDTYVQWRQNNTCASADPFCTDNGLYQFPAGVNAGSGESGPNYDCLNTTPNPAWYYMRMDNPGNMNIYMYSTPSKDIDFCCWGPFSDPESPCPYGLTSSKVVSCSYSSNATETCAIPSSAQTGDYFILVITNYSNAQCNISFSKTSGSGTTDCSILPPLVNNDGPYCVGETIQLSANANGQSGASFNWTGPGGYTSTQQNPTRPNCTTAMSGTYTCTITIGNQSENASTNVEVNTIPVANAGNDQQVNYNNSATLTATAVSGASYSWQPANKINGANNTQTIHTVSLTEATTFTLTVTKNGCSDTDQVTVTVGAQMTASVAADENDICQGGTTTLRATAAGGNGTYNYSWAPAQYVNNPTSANTTVKNTLNPGDYTFTCTINDGQATMSPQVSLHINEAEDQTTTVAVCPSELPYILELPDGTTQSFNQGTGDAGWHTTVPNQFGCLVNVSLYLTVNDVVENEFPIETCNEPYTFVDNGVIIKVLENTCVFDTVYPYGECEKHVIIHFTRHQVYDANYAGTYVADNYPEHHCDSYTWTGTDANGHVFGNGQTYNQRGNFTHTFHSIHGCDSIVTLHLDENNLSFTVDGPQPTQLTDACKNNAGYYMWGPSSVGKKIWTSDTINGSLYDHTFAGMSSKGCDSIGHIKIRLYSRPHVNEELNGKSFVIPGLGFIPYVYEYSVAGLFGAGVETDHPAEYIWEVFSYYDTPNHVPGTENETLWYVQSSETDPKTALLYVNEEGNALLRCTIKTMCGNISTEKFIYTEGYQTGQNINEINYDNLVNVFPNPSDGNIYIGYSEFLSSEQLTISIFSYNGMMIDQFYSNTDNNVTEYSTYKLPNGLYFIRITGKDFSVTKKLVLKGSSKN